MDEQIYTFIQKIYPLELKDREPFMEELNYVWETKKQELFIAIFEFYNYDVSIQEKYQKDLVILLKKVWNKMEKVL